LSKATALAAISSVASEQWGMITANQARRVGVSRQNLNRLIDGDTCRDWPGQGPIEDNRRSSLGGVGHIRAQLALMGN
jgi:hypothetical protein